MFLINIPTMAEIVREIVIGENEPCHFHGEPGSGKSEGMALAVKELDAQLIDFRVGQYDTVDFRGYPDIDRETNTTVWHMASTLPFIGNPKFDPDRKKVIFFDERDHGTDAVQGILYQITQERRVGEHQLQPNTYICSAGNRKSDKGVGGRSFKPLENRNTHFEVGPDAQVWCNWALGQDRVPGELIAFLRFREPLISNFDPKSPLPNFATPRTWEKAGKYFTNPNLSDTTRDAAIHGAVGEAAASEFIGFCRTIKDMVSLDEIKANPLTVAVSDQPEVRWATSVGIAGALAKDPTTATPFQKFLKRMDPEFGILAWQLALKQNSDGLLGVPEFIEVAREHAAIFASVNR